MSARPPDSEEYGTRGWPPDSEGERVAGRALLRVIAPVDVASFAWETFEPGFDGTNGLQRLVARTRDGAEVVVLLRADLACAVDGPSGLAAVCACGEFVPGFEFPGAEAFADAMRALLGNVGSREGVEQQAQLAFAAAQGRHGRAGLVRFRHWRVATARLVCRLCVAETAAV